MPYIERWLRFLPFSSRGIPTEVKISPSNPTPEVELRTWQITQAEPSQRIDGEKPVFALWGNPEKPEKCRWQKITYPGHLQQEDKPPTALVFLEEANPKKKRLDLAIRELRQPRPNEKVASLVLYPGEPLEETTGEAAKRIALELTGELQRLNRLNPELRQTVRGIIYSSIYCEEGVDQLLKANLEALSEGTPSGDPRIAELKEELTKILEEIALGSRELVEVVEEELKGAGGSGPLLRWASSSPEQRVEIFGPATEAIIEEIGFHPQPGANLHTGRTNISLEQLPPVAREVVEKKWGKEYSHAIALAYTGFPKRKVVPGEREWRLTISLTEQERAEEIWPLLEKNPLLAFSSRR